MHIAQEKENSSRWFAIRVTYSREMVVKSRLDARKIACYVPMHWAQKTYAGKTRKVWTPLIHNLLFMCISPEELKKLKTDPSLPIRYIIDPQTKSPMVIPERQMQDFMAVVAAQSEHVEIVPPQEIDLTRGDRVRVTEGVFAGIEGHYVRHKGHSKVAVAICNVATALTAYVSPKYIEKIPEDASGNQKP